MATSTLAFKWPAESPKPIDPAKALQTFQDNVATPQATITEFVIEAEPLQARQVSALHQITLSDTPIRDAVEKHQMPPELMLGIVSNAFLTLGFIEFQSKLKLAQAQLKTAEQKAEFAKGKAEGILGFTDAFATIGLRGFDEAHLVAAARELQADPKAFDAIVTMHNTGVAAALATSGDGKKAVGSFVPKIGKVPGQSGGVIYMPPTFCNQVVTGSQSWHFADSFALQITLHYRCITGWITVWGVPVWPIWGTCSKTYTLASLSYAGALQIGYSLTCCGGTAWGNGSASVCASLLGTSYCASCSANLVGAVGVSKISASQCTYGLGLIANLKCNFGSVTVLNVNYPLYYQVKGPCPPKGFKC